LSLCFFCSSGECVTKIERKPEPPSTEEAAEDVKAKSNLESHGEEEEEGGTKGSHLFAPLAAARPVSLASFRIRRATAGKQSESFMRFTQRFQHQLRHNHTASPPSPPKANR
jgi:hypothetical protein